MVVVHPLPLPELAYNLLTAYDLLDRLSGAVFLLHRAHHPRGYEDASIFFCTPDAAKLFGYDNPLQMHGKFISDLIAPDDLIRVRSYAIAADFRQHAPAQYQIHLRQPDGHMPLVDIEAYRHWENGLTRFWIGILRKAEKAYSQELPLPPEQLALFWKQRMVDFPSLAMMQAIPPEQEPHSELAPHIQDLLEWLQHGRSVNSQLTKLLSQKTIMSRQKKLDTVDKPQGLVLKPGETAMIRPGWYLHWCMHCLEPFRSKEPDPKQCGRRGCRKKGWRTGADYTPQTRKKTYSRRVNSNAGS
jgi:hypothetical protein